MRDKLEGVCDGRSKLNRVVFQQLPVAQPVFPAASLYIAYMNGSERDIEKFLTANHEEFDSLYH